MLPYTTSMETFAPAVSKVQHSQLTHTKLISLFCMSGHTFELEYKNVRVISPPPPLWAEFWLTQRDSFGMLWLIMVVHILQVF